MASTELPCGSKTVQSVPEVVIDNDVLISLVEAKQVLWDKTLEEYKDRNATKEAWKLVCSALREDFEQLVDKEKNEFGRAVVRRWTNLRDAFFRSQKKVKDSKKSGAGAINSRKYIYSEQMQFLKKLCDSREVAESLDESSMNIGDEGIDDDLTQVTTEDEPFLPSRKEKNKSSSKKRNRQEEVELKMLKALDQPEPNPHMSFYQGLLPHLNAFNDAEVLEFQMDVLQSISKIKNRNYHPAQPPPQIPPYYQPNYPYPQAQPFPQPQQSPLYHHPPQFQPPPPPKRQRVEEPVYQQLSRASESPEITRSESNSPALSVCTDLNIDFC